MNNKYFQYYEPRQHAPWVLILCPVRVDAQSLQPKSLLLGEGRQSTYTLQRLHSRVARERRKHQNK
jgi:hypothetical protein